MTTHQVPEQSAPQAERKYRKTVQEAEREITLSGPLSPAEDAMLHREMTEDHIAVAQATMTRAARLLEAVRPKRAQSDPQHPGPSTA